MRSRTRLASASTCAALESMLVAFMAVQQEAGSAARLLFYNSLCPRLCRLFTFPELVTESDPQHARAKHCLGHHELIARGVGAGQVVGQILSVRRHGPPVLGDARRGVIGGVPRHDEGRDVTGLRERLADATGAALDEGVVIAEGPLIPGADI